MEHPIYRVTSVEPLGSYRLRVGFDDQSAREIDLGTVLAARGESHSAAVIGQSISNRVRMTQKRARVENPPKAP
jgi:hypothetical protein